MEASAENKISAPGATGAEPAVNGTVVTKRAHAAPQVEEVEDE